jgi:hypothetical protein
MGPQFFLKPIILKIDQVLLQDTILQVIECGAVERVLFLERADISSTPSGGVF